MFYLPPNLLQRRKPTRHFNGHHADHVPIRLHSARSHVKLLWSRNCTKRVDGIRITAWLLGGIWIRRWEIMAQGRHMRMHLSKFVSGDELNSTFRLAFSRVLLRLQQLLMGCWNKNNIAYSCAYGGRDEACMDKYIRRLQKYPCKWTTVSAVKAIWYAHNW